MKCSRCQCHEPCDCTPSDEAEERAEYWEDQARFLETEIAKYRDLVKEISEVLSRENSADAVSMIEIEIESFKGVEKTLRELEK